ncbi:hypothetical protein GUITHDRAFT_99202 [Guillardia theta CCMP2712]|uniref:Sulfotransferase domain-containing protein n=1 Tax=Guillardia theta (strain CCMP2712) TaxID=905079 RepID=L1K4Z2_GUITC|nr:hypothetical protein GUITHDRAFT_99202 [Guillardia theta CCMP2712]EKX55423.1 hypothetical protein GUITHDRAFT_99202 [Guillardia theta CCMP2712]|eukprot:XP_005842403.1 hypothetical protein GUITHDRAFT_99202 [Guillardia theta CCMP2712]
MVWPTVFIIGSPKAGTTSLAAMLFHHPKFCAPKHAVGNKIPRSLHGKCRFIVVCENLSLGISPGSITLGRRMGFRSTRKDKALECYREVVREDLRLHASSYNLQGGIYVQQLQAWLKSFDRNQTFVVNFDSLMSDSKATLAGLGKFLGADNTEWRKLNLPHLNAQHHLSKARRQS